MHVGLHHRTATQELVLHSCKGTTRVHIVYAFNINAAPTAQAPRSRLQRLQLRQQRKHPAAGCSDYRSLQLPQPCHRTTACQPSDPSPSYVVSNDAGIHLTWARSVTGV